MKCYSTSEMKIFEHCIDFAEYITLKVEAVMSKLKYKENL